MNCSIRNGGEDLLTTTADAFRLDSEDTTGAVPVFRPKLSLIVPTFNEAENIAPFLRSVYSVLGPVLGDSFEVIVVDDDSPDGTWRLASDLCAALPNLRVLRRREERGLASAVIRGWQAARGEILGVIDADFQHQPEVLARMVEAAGNWDVVVASRFCAGGGVGDWPMYRRLASKGASLLGLALVPEVFRRTSDPLSGCYAVHRRAVEGLEFYPLGYKGLIEILARGHVATIGECAYQMCKRKSGRSKADFRECWRYVRHLLRLRRTFREAARCR